MLAKFTIFFQKAQPVAAKRTEQNHVVCLAVKSRAYMQMLLNKYR